MTSGKRAIQKYRQRQRETQVGSVTNRYRGVFRNRERERQTGRDRKNDNERGRQLESLTEKDRYIKTEI